MANVGTLVKKLTVVLQKRKPLLTSVAGLRDYSESTACRVSGELAVFNFLKDA
jgi:hypothetical protein